MENTKNSGSDQNRISKLLLNQEFLDFYSYKEDKWLQNSDIEEKLKVVFGSVENAIIEFEKDEIFNITN